MTRKDTTALDRLADGLGLVSIGLGMLEMLAPHAVGRRVGLKDHDRVIQLYGVRGVATGVGLLMARDADRPAWLWGRVAGGALDVMTLAAGTAQVGPRKRQRAAMAMGAVVGVAALDLLCAWKLGEEQDAPRRGPMRDYSSRSGFRETPAAMRGKARDAKLPLDMLTPEALRPHGVL